MRYKTPSETYETIEIPRGNWDAYSLQNFLSANLVGHKVVYDEGNLHFCFLPDIYISNVDSRAAKLLGIPTWFSSFFFGTLTESINSVNLSTVQRIHVESNLTINNIPLSGRLAVIPVEQNFGEMIDYFDADGLNKVLCLDHVIGRIEIWFTDQDGNPLESYLGASELPGGHTRTFPEWQLTLSITPQDNVGFVEMPPGNYR